MSFDENVAGVIRDALMYGCGRDDNEFGDGIGIPVDGRERYEQSKPEETESKGGETMTDGSESYDSIERELRETGAREYRQSDGAYGEPEDSEEQDQVIQALGAALKFENALDEGNVQEQADELREMELYLSDQGLRDDFVQYKEDLGNKTPADRAAENVLGVLDTFESYAEKTEHFTTLNNAASQEVANEALQYASALRDVTQKASSIDVDSFSAPDRLERNLRELSEKTDELGDIGDDIEESLEEF